MTQTQKKRTRPGIEASLWAALVAARNLVQEPRTLLAKHLRQGRGELITALVARWLVVTAIARGDLPPAVGKLEDVPGVELAVAKLVLAYHQCGGFVTNKITTVKDFVVIVYNAWKAEHVPVQKPTWDRPLPDGEEPKEQAIVLTAMSAARAIDLVSADTWKRLEDSVPMIVRNSGVPLTVPTDYLLIPPGALEGLCRKIGILGLECVLDPEAATHRLAHPRPE